MRSQDADRFDNVLDLQTAHLGMMQRQHERLARDGQPLDSAEVAAFLDRVRRTGAVLADPEDRRKAQRVLDYWSADLLDVARGFDGHHETEGLAPFVPGSEGDAAGDLLEDRSSREYIRLAAQARQWRDTRAKGYLISGKALRSAEKFSRDPEIADLIAASLVEERRDARRALRRKRIAMGLTLAVLASLAVAVVAYREADDAVSLKAIARSGRDDARRLANEQTLDLEQRQRRLDDAVTALADMVIADRLALRQVPESVRSEVLAVLAVRLADGRLDRAALAPDVAAAVEAYAPAVKGSVFGEDLNGYDPDFLGRTLPLPRLGPALLADGYQDGAPVPYLNFSFVFDRARRAPFYAAINLDRMQRRVLPATETPIEPDPRLPPELRPNPDRFAGGLVPADYVPRDYITWGPLLEEGPIRAARLADQSVQIHLNKAPVHPDTAKAWSDQVAWIRDAHNSLASRVTFFTGPVFKDDDPDVPSALWLVAVSLRDALGVPFGQEQPLVAEGFLIPNRADIDRLQKSQFIFKIQGIGLATGLIFPEALVNADRNSNIGSPTEGDQLARGVGELDQPPSPAQAALIERLGNVVGGRETLRESEQAKVVRALLGMLGRMTELSPGGQVNLLTVLNEVPPASWNRTDWVGMKADARRKVTMLRAPGAEPAGEAEALLGMLVPQLDLDVTQSQTAYLQFAGMTRERARGFAAALRNLGWTVPEEERVTAAQSLNEVRFNPGLEADAAAALLLAADLEAAGRSGIRATPNGRIRPGTLEIWIGSAQ
ncbi:DNA/RNA non-specific endonuclease [Rhodobacter sp. CZR27]|uniref:DNA/RNA non-specific endonuclease n=1 Tax=Rhodobacter sp. CZR27 TaxID=2033869 RepID=UPI000BBE92C1|nr:DNA/RNA non-specific endonuclease [Rhodobacter sp. CZR27]